MRRCIRPSLDKARVLSVVITAGCLLSLFTDYPVDKNPWHTILMTKGEKDDSRRSDVVRDMPFFFLLALKPFFAIKSLLVLLVELCV